MARCIANRLTVALARFVVSCALPLKDAASAGPRYTLSPYNIPQKILQARTPCSGAHLDGTSSRALSAAGNVKSWRF